MGEVFYKDPKGNTHRVIIAGTEPTPEEEKKISIALGYREPDPGIVGAFTKNFGTFDEQIQKAGGVIGAFAAEKNPNLFGDPQDYWDYVDKKSEEIAKEGWAPDKGFYESDSWYDSIRGLAATAGSSAPSTLIGLGSGLAGAAVGGPVAGAALGTIVGAAAYTAPILNENIDAQRAEHGYVKDWDKAFAATGFNALIESVTDQILLKAGSVVGKAARESVNAGIKKGLTKALAGSAGRIGKVTAGGALTGAIEESLQAAATRWQAELPLMDDEAKKEYLENATAGAILEGLMGGGLAAAQTPINKIMERKLNQAKQAGEYKQKLGQELGGAYVEDPINSPIAIKNKIDSVAASFDAKTLKKAPKLNLPTSADVSEIDYAKALEAVSGKDRISRAMLRPIIGKGKKSDAILDLMTKRGDLAPDNKNPKFFKPSQTALRDYVIGEIKQKPAYELSYGKEKKTFATEKEAQQAAESAGVKKFDIQKLELPPVHGLYEVRHDNNGQVVGRQLLNTYKSQAEAGAARSQIDPLYVGGDRKTGSYFRQLAAQKNREDIENQRLELKKFIDGMTGKDTNVMVSTDQRDFSPDRNNLYQGSYSVNAQGEPLIKLAANFLDPNATPQDKVQFLKRTANHEVLHYMKRQGMLAPNEWNELVKAARSRKMPGKNFTFLQSAMGRQLTTSSRGENLFFEEEAVAEMLEEYAVNPQRFPAKQRNILQKILDLILSAFGVKRGKDGAVDIMQSIIDGDFRDRDAGSKAPIMIGSEMFSRVPAPAFFMQSAKAIMNIPMKSGSAQQWINALRKNNVKPDEISWLGLEEIPGTITKEELGDHIKAHNFVIKEKKTFSKQEVDVEALAELENQMFELVDAYNQLSGMLDQPYYFEPYDDENISIKDISDFERTIYNQRTRLNSFLWNNDSIKKNDRMKLHDVKNKLEELYDELDDISHDYTKTVLQIDETPYSDMILPGEVEDYGVLRFVLPDIYEIEYGGGHFEPNTLMHARITYRNDNGKRILVIEEVQSDWVKDYEKEERRIAAARASIKTINIEEARENDNQFRELEDAFNKATHPAHRDVIWKKMQEADQKLADLTGRDAPYKIVREFNGSYAVLKRGRQSYSTIYTKLNLDRAVQFVNVASFEKLVNNTPKPPMQKSWDEYIFKRMIRYAAEEGIDELVWPGSPEAVANVEKWGTLERKPINDKNGNFVKEGFFKPVPEEYGGPVNVTQIIEQYTVSLPKIASKIGQKFGSLPRLDTSRAVSQKKIAIDAGVVADIAEQTAWNVSNIPEHLRYIHEKMKQEKGNLTNLQFRRKITSKFNESTAIDSYQRGADSLGIPLEVFMELGDFWEVFDLEFHNGGLSGFAVYRMPITDQLKDHAIYEGWQMFSKVPNPQAFPEGYDIQTRSLVDNSVKWVSDLGPDDERTKRINNGVKYANLPKNHFSTYIIKQSYIRGDSPQSREMLAKAKLYDRGLTSYGDILLTYEPPLASEYMYYRNFKNATTPLVGLIENPETGKKEPAVVQWGGEWINDGSMWPAGYGMRHAMWHFKDIQKVTGGDPATEILKAIQQTKTLKMQKGKRAIIEAKDPKWSRPLYVVMERIDSPQSVGSLKRGDPVWRMVTAFTNRARDISMYSAVPNPMYSATAAPGSRVPTVTANEMDAYYKELTYDNVSRKLGEWAKFILPKLRLESWNKPAEAYIKRAVELMADKLLPLAELVDKVKKEGSLAVASDTYIAARLMDGKSDYMLDEKNRLLYKPLLKKVSDLSVETDAIKNFTRQMERDQARTNGPALDETREGVVRAMDNISTGEFTDLTRHAAYAFDEQYADKRVAVTEMVAYALHAKEANQVARQRNEKLKAKRPMQYEYGSGMTDTEADTILAWASTQPWWGQMERDVIPSLRNVVKDTNVLRVNFGLGPNFESVVDENGNPIFQYKNYVPLKGWLEDDVYDDLGDVKPVFARAGKGFSVRGKEDFSRTGRTSLAADIIGNTILQNEEAILRGQKNAVNRTLLDMMEDPANAEIFKDVAQIVERVQMKPFYNSKTGLVQMIPDHLKGNDYLWAKREKMYEDENGNPYEGVEAVAINILDSRLRRALTQKNSLNQSQFSGLFKMLLKFNRFMGAMRTSYNPEFMFPNFVRDFITAQVGLSEVDAREVRAQFVRELPGIMKGIREYINSPDKQNLSENAQLFVEFWEAGGRTAQTGLKTLEDTIDKINENLTDLPGTQENVKTKGMATIKKIGEFIENWNDTVENMTRVAVYKAVRDKLMQPRRTGRPMDISEARRLAAYAARNATVDFNAGGELKPYMNAMYLFFNASMQGSMTLLNSLRSPRVRKIWATAIGAGLMQDVIMSMISDEDDAGEKYYDKIPEHILQHNMIFLAPWSEKGYISIPLPYLFNSAYNAGRSAMRMVRGGYTPGEAFNSTFGTALASINPVGGNSFMNFVAPTILDPFVDLARNQNFADQPIFPEASPFGIDKRDSQRFFNNTSPIYTTISNWLANAPLIGGEGDYIPGMLEVSPNVIEYWVEWLGGGTLTFVRRVFDAANVFSEEGSLPQRMINGSDWSANDIPIVRRFYNNSSDRADMNFYVTNRDKILRIDRSLNAAIANKDRSLVLSLREQYPDELAAAKAIKKIESKRRKISSLIEDIRESNLSTEEKRAEIARLKQIQTDLVQSANKFFIDL